MASALETNTPVYITILEWSRISLTIVNWYNVTRRDAKKKRRMEPKPQLVAYDTSNKYSWLLEVTGAFVVALLRLGLNVLTASYCRLSNLQRALNWDKMFWIDTILAAEGAFCKGGGGLRHAPHKILKSRGSEMLFLVF